MSETWDVKEVLNGTTLKASRGRKNRQFQLCGVQIVPGAEQQAIAYLQLLIENSNNQVYIVPVKQSARRKWLGEVFVGLGEDRGEELASGLLIIKGLATVSPTASECFYQEGLELAEELATEELASPNIK